MEPYADMPRSDEFRNLPVDDPCSGVHPIGEVLGELLARYQLPVADGVVVTGEAAGAAV